jgi:hypothetical protein
MPRNKVHVASRRDHGIVGFELPDSVFLLYPTRDTVGDTDMCRGIRD